MEPRAWRQLALLTQTARAHTGAAGDSCLRLAMALWAADVRATITAKQRQWVIARLETEAGAARPLTAREKARLKEPLLAYLTAYHARTQGDPRKGWRPEQLTLVDLVRAQFEEEGA